MLDEKIMKGGRVMRVLCDVALCVVPLAVLASLFLWPDGLHPLSGAAGLQVSENVTPLQTALAVAVGLVPLAILMWTILQMRGLFALFGRGAVLTRAVAAQIRRIGQGFLILALIPLVVIPVQSVLLSWANPEGERMLSVAVSSNMLGFAVVSGLLILIGWAMAQAADVAAENESFV